MKDLISASEGPTTAQSLVLDPEWAGRIDAPVVTRLRAGGAVIMGKTGTAEFATGLPDPQKPFPISRNPWDLDRYTGGSSTGNSSGVAAGLFLGALGTDTGGSIRFPAALVGITGLKATFGRVPKSGCVPLGYSYDHIGPMARSAADCAAILGVIAGYHDGDPYSVNRPVSDYLGALTTDLTRVRIGYDLLLGESDHADNLEGLMREALGVLERAGAELIPIRLPHYREVSDATMLGYTTETFADQRATMASRWLDYSAATRIALATGGLVTSADYVQMQKVRRFAQQRVARIFDGVDLIITPTSGTPAPRLDGLEHGALTSTVHTPYWSSVGNPAMSVPVGFSPENLPLGMQIVGKPFAETDVLTVGYAFQTRTDWHLRVPRTVSAAAA